MTEDLENSFWKISGFGYFLFFFYWKDKGKRFASNTYQHYSLKIGLGTG